MRNILEQGVHLHVLSKTKPFIPPGSINRYRLRPGVEVLSAATGTTWLAWQPVGGADEATHQRSPLGDVLLRRSYL